MANIKSNIQLLREEAEADLWIFARLVNPTYLYGDIHKEAFYYLQANGLHSLHTLLMLPRGHLKSHLVATYSAWRITREPYITILYLTANEELGKDQIYAIKNMMTSVEYRKLWPEMIKTRESDREHWSAFSFNVDHKDRKNRRIRDHTLMVKTIKSSFTGHHADILIFDDIVIPNNAYSEVGRREVSKAVSQCFSILNPGGSIAAVGTRYHPQDQYNSFMTATFPLWCNIEKDWIGEEKFWNVFERTVESSGDGTGEFIWPKQYDDKGLGFGFDTQTLAKIRAGYITSGDAAQFYAQYYNNPNDNTSNNISRDMFKYYEPKFIQHEYGQVYFHGNGFIIDANGNPISTRRKLNLFAAMDVAWTDSSEIQSAKADYTAIAVIGVDEDFNIFILDLTRFKTNKFNVYYDEVMALHKKWGFRKLKIETNAGGKLVAVELERLIRADGGLISIEHKSNSGAGIKSKKMRLYAVVLPKYELGMIYHRRDGLSSVLEEEIVLERPAHDDLADALGMAVEGAKAPYKEYNDNDIYTKSSNVLTHARFGGRRGR